MRLPIIKHATQFIENNDTDYVIETIEVLEHLCGAKGIKNEELDVIGELISNLNGAIEVEKLIANGQTKKDALNNFMKRVIGSIDK